MQLQCWAIQTVQTAAGPIQGRCNLGAFMRLDSMSSGTTHLPELFESVVAHVIVLEHVYAVILITVVPDFVDNCALPFTIFLLDLGQGNYKQCVVIRYVLAQSISARLLLRSISHPNCTHVA